MVNLLEHNVLCGQNSVRHGFFTRNGGVSEGLHASLNCGYGSNDNKEAVRENRSRAARAFGRAAEDICTAYQIHGAAAVEVTRPWRPENSPKADALVSSTPGVVLGILTADCAPVLLADGENRVIGALHAGWRGALGGVLEAGVAGMYRLGSQVTKIRAAIGPTIGPQSFEVSAGFPEPFLALDSAAKMFFRPATHDGHYLFDLPGYVTHRLKALGLAEVISLGRDTYTEEAHFFSYRRNSHQGENNYGRLLSAITLES